LRYLHRKGEKRVIVEVGYIDNIPEDLLDL